MKKNKILFSIIFFMAINFSMYAEDPVDVNTEENIDEEETFKSNSTYSSTIIKEDSPIIYQKFEESFEADDVYVKVRFTKISQIGKKARINKDMKEELHAF